jgi:translation initiation factor eIF-2B subunit delta
MHTTRSSLSYHYQPRIALNCTGRNLLKALSSHSIPTTYTLLPTLSPLLQQANLVLLGASALYANGSLHSRAGTALVAMLAKEYRVPVVVAVETYKFSDGTRLDGLGMNEVDINWMGGQGGGVEDNVKKGNEMEGNGNLTKLALSYDLTPVEYITALCTEVSLLAIEVVDFGAHV